MIEASPHQRFNASPVLGAASPHFRGSRVSKCFIGLVVVWLSAAQTQLARPEAITTRSYSGQFIIHGQNRPGLPARALGLATNLNLVSLQPVLLTISCERIKQNLARQLGATEPWRGKIHIMLHPAVSADDPITITSESFKDSWQYWVELPDLVQRVLYVRAMVQVLLLEMANRNARERSAEIPRWLIEGLSEQLLASSEIEIILPPPRASANGIGIAPAFVSARLDDPLSQAHKQLLSRPPLTFEELSWPANEQISGELGGLYRSSAQLFVNELLRLKDGRACLLAMVAQLPRYYNWQVAFLRAFQPYFQRPLDVEKWWALRLVYFTGRDLTQTWPLDESLRKLEEIIRFPVEVRGGPNELPLRAQITLQTIIRQWDRPRQTQALQSKVRELEPLRLRVARELVMLVEGYRETLETYLQALDKNRFLLLLQKGATPGRVAEDAIGQLDALDARREALRPEQKPVAAAQAQPGAIPRR